jgi:glycosyltransferase domain-containing protein
MNIKNKITIIIPTLNRPISLKNSIEYYKKLPFSVKYFDGSNKKIKIKNLSKNIKYFHIPNLGLYERLDLSLKYIKTPYVILGTDDEFYTYEGLISCLSKLETKKEYISCIGQCIKFFSVNKKLFTFLGYKENLKNTIDQSDYEIRIKKHLQNYAPKYIYSLSRSFYWKKSVKNLISLKFPAFAIGELVFEISMAFYGKILIQKKLFWFRNYNNIPINSPEEYLKPKNKLDDWWNHIQQKNKENIFLEKFSKSLDKKNSKSLKKIIQLSINNYCNQKNVIKKMNAKKINFIQRIINKINFFLYHFYFLKNDKNDLKKILYKNKINFCTKELDLVFKFIK